MVNGYFIAIWLFNQKSGVDSSMKKYKFRYIHLLLVPVMVVVLCLAWHTVPMIFNPMRRPAPMIRNHILRHTPIGMCKEEVVRVIENNERWGTPEINTWSGFLHPALFVDGPDGSPTPAIIGDTSVQARPEWYNVPIFERHVRIFWGFDENGKLIEVYVYSGFRRQLV